MAKILVVDDEEGVRSFLAEALELDDHLVTTAADGNEAARLLALHGFDALLTDLKMPGMDGMALLRKVREEQPELEVIVLTAFGTVDSAVAAMKAGAFDYLQKPIGSPAELRLIVSRALERRALLNLKTERAQAPTAPLTWGAPSMRPVVDALRKVAATQANVLLLGESGTGKEVTARTLHQWSSRAEGPFVAVNCAALSETLLESELFGHEKGAFTGAVAQRRGRIELAQGGTFFLDELGELKPELQAKLLRVLQERRFERLGGTRTLTADVRWIAATNRDLRAMIAEGRFREDLYHRLAVFPVYLPPLSERREEIRPLSLQLLQQIGAELGYPRLQATEDALARLASAEWPGNIRELRNTLERAVILSGGAPLRVEHLWFDPTHPQAERAARPGPPRGQGPTPSLQDLEREAIEQALTETHGNRKQAAERLGIGLRTLYEKLKRYQLKG